MEICQKMKLLNGLSCYYNPHRIHPQISLRINILSKANHDLGFTPLNQLTFPRLSHIHQQGGVLNFIIATIFGRSLVFLNHAHRESNYCTIRFSTQRKHCKSYCTKNYYYLHLISTLQEKQALSQSSL